MQIGRMRYHVEWGHLAFATLMAFVIVAYLLNVRSVSTNINNTIFVQPVALLEISLYVLIAVQCFRPADSDQPSRTAEASEDEAADSPAETLRVVSMMAALGLYVFSLNLLGFDMATWLFALIATFVCGERNPLKLLVFPLLLALLTVYGFRFIIPFPMPTTFL